MYGPAQARTFQPHPCRPCASGQYNPQFGADKCQACPESTPDAPRYCGFAAMKPVPLNWTELHTGFGHAWESLQENVFEETWKFGIWEYKVNESSLQVLFLLLSMMLLGVVIVICQCISFCSRGQIVTNVAWDRAKQWLLDADQFTDQHSRHIGGQEKDEKTIIGGFASVLFVCLAWSLCSVVLFMFASFNESIQQTLVPTAESKDAEPLRPVV